MEDVIADKIAEYPEMRELNREWSAQFEKYAHAWMPKLFPANYYKEMINYWIPFAADQTIVIRRSVFRGSQRLLIPARLQMRPHRVNT